MHPVHFATIGVVSLAFGVVFATSVTLFLVPCSLLMADDLKKAAAGFRGWYLRPFRKATSTTGH